MNTVGEEIENWRAGRVKPLCVFSAQGRSYTLGDPAHISAVQVSSAAERGVDLCYRSTYGVLAPADSPPQAVAEGAELLSGVSATDDWQAFLARRTPQCRLPGVSPVR